MFEDSIEVTFHKVQKTMTLNLKNKTLISIIDVSPETSEFVKIESQFRPNQFCLFYSIHLMKMRGFFPAFHTVFILLMGFAEEP
jgi:hypothetical protein